MENLEGTYFEIVEMENAIRLEPINRIDYLTICLLTICQVYNKLKLTILKFSLMENKEMIPNENQVLTVRMDFETREFNEFQAILLKDTKERSVERKNTVEFQSDNNFMVSFSNQMSFMFCANHFIR